MNPFAIDHDPQLQSPDRQLKPGLEAIDIASDRHPPRLGGDQGFHPGPPTQGYFDRVEAALAVEQLEQILLEKGRVQAEFQRQRAPGARESHRLVRARSAPRPWSRERSDDVGTSRT